MHSATLTGIVLKSTNFKDADKIYTVFTREKGKVSVAAKGVRKISSKRAGTMDTLNYVSIGVVESPSGYKTLTEAKNLNSFKNLKVSLENSVRGFYLAELIHKLMEEEHPHVDIFDLFLETLTKLNHHLNNEISRVNAFEIALMGAMGYEMYLDKCAKTNIPYSEGWTSIKFNATLGGLVSDPTVPGLSLTKEAANLLFSLKTKKSIPKSLLVDLDVVREANKLIKIFVNEVVDSNMKSSSILSS